MDGLDIGRLLSIVAEGIAQQSDRLEQRRLGDEGVGPDRVHQCLLRHDHAGGREQRRQHADRARRQRHRRGRRATGRRPANERETRRRDWPTGFRTSSGHLEDIHRALLPILGACHSSPPSPLNPSMPHQPLKRVLGPIDLTLLGIGAIIGTGIFVLTGQAAAAHAGPAVVLSMIVAGIASGLAAICYSEFASSVPVAGSAYTYGYATLGELVAWIIGWDLILEYALGAATVAVGWSAYVVSFLHDVGITLSAAAERGARHRRGPGRRLERDGALQPAGDADLGGGDDAAADRHPGVGAGQRGDRRGQGRRRAADHRPRRDVHLHRELAPVHSGQHRRVRRIRLERHRARRRRDLLRLHRLRCGLDGGAGIAESAARHAARHHRIADHLHDPLRAGVGRDGRPGAVSAARRAGADGAGGRRRAHQGGGHRRGNRCST